MRAFIVFKIFILTTVFFCASSSKLSAQQDNSKAFAAADSSKFSPDKKDGWQLFNSYVSALQNDSATVELIIQHANNIDWTQEQYVGKIKFQGLQPATGQTLPFNLLNDNYTLRIDNSGKCYLRFVSGNAPTHDPMIIPLKVFYKL